MIISLYQYMQLICLLVSIIFLAGLKKFSIAAFMPLLIIINVVEMIGTNYRLFGWEKNDAVYNLFLIISTPFYLYLYLKMLNLKEKALNLFFVISILCLLFVLLNYFLLQGISKFNSYSAILISILNIIFSCLILFRLSLQEVRELNLFKEPYFWINAVNLLFYIVTLVLLGMQPYIRSHKIEIYNKSLYYVILPPANIILYGGYSYAFLLCWNQKNRS